MKRNQLQPVRLKEELTKNFLHTLRFVLCATGHVLLAATIWSIMTQKEVLISSIVDGSILKVLPFALLGIIAVSLGSSFVKRLSTKLKETTAGSGVHYAK